MKRLFALAAFALTHCASDPTAAPAASDAGAMPLDGSIEAEGGRSDAANADAGTDKWTTVNGFEPGSPPTNEMEPNNGATPTELNPMAIPSRTTGAIGSPDDQDIFSLPFTTGRFVSLRIIPDGSNLEPKLSVFDTNRNSPNPTRIVRTNKKTVAPRLITFVLNAGSFVGGVQDVRNTGTSARVGGPDFKYSIEATTVSTTPIKASFPMVVKDTLQNPGDLGVIGFTGTRGFAFSIVVRAKRKTVPSDLDTRVSLFSVTNNSNVLTNDNLPSSTDSEIRGQLPFDGEYLLIVEDEADHMFDAPLDLSYEVEFKAN
jgi:hypothetical protein